MSPKYLFAKGDVLYSKLRPYLRKAIVADSRGLCSADMYPIRVDRSRVEPDWLAWMLVSDRFTAFAVGASARARTPEAYSGASTSRIPISAPEHAKISGA